MNKLSYNKFTANDFSNYYSLVSDERVMAQITERSIPLAEAKDNYKKLLKRNEKHTIFGSYQFYCSETGVFIGLGHLTINEEQEKEAELGYMLLPEHWGKGFGNEIASLLMSLAQKTDVTELKAIIDPANIPSRKILINQGFISEHVAEIDGLPGEILSLTL
ncbi:GNAT family N-acetyltransferase [Bacillus sp. B1-b2]|uniref:GNAT family N-acetyltransferase n=1 Tax=Bacillus sp. B1-b2 TaxID=2653201 RepID=UPI00126218CA|nr:GNAT family N-acetyltransferase [Bacillus sp. B1-b2]KAB7668886.1 GNAT family N-acetyltransferase [Bacillus sp. B1-b2]